MVTGNIRSVAIRGREETEYSEVREIFFEHEEMIKKALELLADEESKDHICRIISDIKSGRCTMASEKVASEMPGLVRKLRNTSKKSDFEMRVPACSVISDIWEIPLFFKKVITEGIIRAKLDESGKVEYTLSSVDKNEVIGYTKHSGKFKPDRVVAISGALYAFSNVDLVKAFGMIPYLFHKIYDCEVKLVSYRGEESYPYLALLPGLKMELIDNDPPNSMVRYIQDNSKNIDLLIIQGAYEYNHDVIVEYKKKNPDGKIFMNLDQNSEWMDRIIWDDPNYREMMDLVDVKGSTCQPMQIHLNEKWPWHIDCIRQGYYDLFGFNDNINEILRNKEKIILCVARHGTWQKATEILLEAFAIIKNDINEWNLEFVGSVEESFNGFINDYFDRFPDLKSRVIFYGNISDRKLLHEHFTKASIFTLTSRIEGGTPNVISEALYSGCAIALTMFDAFPDAIGPLDEDDRICGLAAPVDDVEGYAAILRKLCLTDKLSEYQENARWRAEKYFDAVKIERYLYGRLCD